MQRGFALAGERSLYKQRLEQSLAALCELDLLKHRQEALVVSALRLGDPGGGRSAWPLLPHCFPNSAELQPAQQQQQQQQQQQGLIEALQQQVGELRVDTETNLMEHRPEIGDSGPSLGFCEQSGSQSPMDSCERTSRTTSPIQTVITNTISKPADVLVASHDGLLDGLGSTGRSQVPFLLSSLQPPLIGMAKRGEGERWIWPETTGLGIEDEPNADDLQAHHMETYILGMIQKRLLTTRQCKPRTNLSPEARGVARQNSQKDPSYTPDHRKTPPNSERPTWASYSMEDERLVGFSPAGQPSGHYSRHEEKLHSHYSKTDNQLSTHYHRPDHCGLHSTTMECRSGDLDPSSSEADLPQNYQIAQSPSSDEQLVNAQYIPAQPTQGPMRAKTSRPNASSKANRGGGETYSPERPHPKTRAIPKKCRFTDDRAATKKTGRKACRSQSENSLLGQKGVPERKYSTVERDPSRGGQSKSRRPQGNLGHRRWRSTLELSQDEAEPQPEREPRRSRKSRPTPPTYVYSQALPHQHYTQHHFHHSNLHSDYPPQSSVCRPEGGYKHSSPVDWESSLSEGESPGSSSMSSDSDESGGLVWPQQLASPLAPPSPPTTSGPPLQSKALVKIKASHALKKKILRFRTGSLKVMTTV